jgi:alkanesulfonate monooxygenase SsuD/methylene tetrahydromethanopterin reductase-like flavin-dependent oxidoreductase (luciferase family)
MLSAATQVTERIKLSTMGLSLALYPHPVRVAEEVAMVDNLSGGRVTMGVMSSGAQNLYSYSLTVDQERGRKEEAYDLIIKAWTEESPFEWHGDYFDYNCVSVLPRPLQTPHPPVWAPMSAEESLEWAARKHVGAITSGSTPTAAKALQHYCNYAAEECDWTPTSADLGIAREFYIAPTKAKFDEMAEEVFNRTQANAYTHMDENPNLKALDKERYAIRRYTYRGYGRDGGREGGRRSMRAIEAGTFIAGDPDSVTQQIIDQQRETGAGVLVIRPEMGGLTLDEVADGLDLFAKEVLPVVKKL